MTNQLTLVTENARFVAPSAGATTWYNGQRCTVIDSAEMAEWMTRVVFEGGRTCIVKTRLLGRWTPEQFAALKAA